MSIGGIGAGSGLPDALALRQQIVEQSDVLRSLNGVKAGQQAPQPPAIGGGFADVMKQAVANVSGVQDKASDLAAAYERGDGTDIAQVMLARQEAGIAFEATLQVRNKLLSAYQEIMRMGI
ncbi:flagellar hook-basal body complex protein FliE [Porphyrobacter sp. GA68]|uniref:flagellar hook-basal body complex protein FliE n=1 Tax=Porphyrobacter sp. GA68 TaxID=2883480 RepID=UPI001D189357|nr:flagellar hook-basal body complex protein FliE [Porphyrobacter sp. GA68]